MKKISSALLFLLLFFGVGATEVRAECYDENNIALVGCPTHVTNNERNEYHSTWTKETKSEKKSATKKWREHHKKVFSASASSSTTTSSLSLSPVASSSESEKTLTSTPEKTPTPTLLPTVVSEKQQIDLADVIFGSFFPEDHRAEIGVRFGPHFMTSPSLPTGFYFENTGGVGWEIFGEWKASEKWAIELNYSITSMKSKLHFYSADLGTLSTSIESLLLKFRPFKKFLYFGFGYEYNYTEGFYGVGGYKFDLSGNNTATPVFQFGIGGTFISTRSMDVAASLDYKREDIHSLLTIPFFKGPFDSSITGTLKGGLSLGF